MAILLGFAPALAGQQIQVASPYGSCFNIALPSPAPTLTGQATSPICINGILQTSGSGGSTPIPCATQATGVCYVAPTALPTINSLNFQGTSPWVVNTPAPFNGVVSGTVTANAGTGFPTPIPYTTAGGSILLSNVGGSLKTILTSASATACTNLEISTTGILAEVINTGAAQSVFLTIYDEGTSPTCAAGDIIYGDGSTLTIGAGQVITFGIPLGAGLSYKLSGALTANVVITYR